MALVVTPGADNADSYASLDEANAYFTARGLTTWTGTDSAKENALRRAADYLENQYRGRWKGYRTSETQSLSWPRLGDEDNRSVRDGFLVAVGIVDDDGFEIPTDVIPKQLKNAQCEAALLILTGVDLQPRLVRGGMVKSIGKGVGPLRKDIVYMDGAPGIDRFSAIEGLLRGLVTSTPGSGVSVVGMVRS